jgi:hypothetical protein
LAAPSTNPWAIVGGVPLEYVWGTGDHHYAVVRPWRGRPKAKIGDKRAGGDMLRTRADVVTLVARPVSSPMASFIRAFIASKASPTQGCLPDALSLRGSTCAL